MAELTALEEAVRADWAPRVPWAQFVAAAARDGLWVQSQLLGRENSEMGPVGSTRSLAPQGHVPSFSRLESAFSPDAAASVGPSGFSHTEGPGKTRRTSREGTGRWRVQVTVLKLGSQGSRKPRGDASSRLFVNRSRCSHLSPVSTTADLASSPLDCWPPSPCGRGMFPARSPLAARVLGGSRLW